MASLLVLIAVYAAFTITAPVLADHTVDHCAEQVGSDNNTDFDLCVDGAPSTIAEQSRWCENNRSDSEFESCMQSVFGIDVTSSNDNETTPSQSTSQPVDFDDDEVTSENDCSADVLTSDNCIIIQYIVRAINILSALAGLAITGSIMIAGYQYMTARDNSGQIEASRKRIIWALIALATLIFTYAFLNFIVPGGVI